MASGPDLAHRILLVDVSSEERQAWRRILCERWSDAEIVEAGSAEEALPLLQARSFGAVISDHSMGGMNGVELLEIAERDHPDALRLLVSGADSFEVARDAINRAHVHGYIRKASGPRAVAERLELLLPKRD